MQPVYVSFRLDGEVMPHSEHTINLTILWKHRLRRTSPTNNKTCFQSSSKGLFSISSLYVQRDVVINDSHLLRKIELFLFKFPTSPNAMNE